MNKKLFSAALFGALLLGTASTFVSCKDYDDDIAGLQTQINDVKASVAAIEAKVNAGKFVTGVNSTADGITISLSDGTSYTVTNGKNGTNGTNGVDGTNGAEWTISEDGFWVCNGEKTDVLAVGQKGEAGENGLDAQPEVKKENGKWYLWNGEEFEEFTTPEAPAAENIPYCFVDPNDANYMNLVVFTEAGEKVTMKLPLNEGLGQIKILDGSISILYTMSTTTQDKWDGSKAKPAKGDYIVGQTDNCFIVEVTPTSYDLSGKVLKVVNSQGTELPVELGAAEPFTGLLTKSASATGLYQIPITKITVNDETVEAFADPMTYSLVANDKVYSGFVPGNPFQLAAFTGTSSISFGRLNAAGTTITLPATVKAVAGKPVTLDVLPLNELYDSYLTMANTVTAKADSVRYGIEFDGLTITSNAKAEGNVNIMVHYYTVDGKSKTQPVTLDYSVTPAAPEVVGEIATTNHTATYDFGNGEQSFLVDLAPYFKSMTTDRLIWNDEFKSITAKSYGDVTPVGGGSAITLPSVKWVYDDPNDGKTKTAYIDGLVDETGFWYTSEDDYIALTGTTITKADAAKIAGLWIPFESDYGTPTGATSYTAYDGKGNAVTLTKKNVFDWGGQFTLQMVVRKNISGTIKDADLIEIPFTIAKPTDETIAAVAASKFTADSYKDGVMTVINTLNAVLPSGLGYADIEYNDDDLSWTPGTRTMKLNDTDNYGKSYDIKGATVQVMGATYTAPTFKVKYVKSADYTLALGKALEVNCDGGTIKIKNGELGAKETGFFTDLTAAKFNGTAMEITKITVSESNKNGGSPTTARLATVDYTPAVAADATATPPVAAAPGYITVTTKTGRIANDVTTYVKIVATVVSGDTTASVTKVVPVTVKSGM